MNVAVTLPEVFAPSEAPETMALFDVDHCGLVIVGFGHRTDLACQLVMESARDWRKLDRLSRRFADSLPEPSVSPRLARRGR
jgi:hypothetical protein